LVALVYIFTAEAEGAEKGHGRKSDPYLCYCGIMKALWLAIACIIVALVVRFGHVGENDFLSYRVDGSTTYAIALNIVVFWLLLAVAVLSAAVETVQRTRAR